MMLNFFSFQAEELDRSSSMVCLRTLLAVRRVGAVVVQWLLSVRAKRSPLESGQMSSS